MTRFHSKIHQKSHHSATTVGYPDSALDPIASHDEPFKGDFVIDGNLYADSLYISNGINSTDIDEFLTTSQLSSTVTPLIPSDNDYGFEVPVEFLPEKARFDNYVGFFDYNASTALSAVALSQNTWIKIENDITGTYTLTSYAPDSLIRVWDESTNNFDWSELRLGDMVDIRLDVEITLSDTSSDIELDLVLAEGSASEYRIPFYPPTTFKSAGTYRITTYSGIYMGNNDTLSSGGFFEVRTDDTAATMKVNGFYCKIIRKSIN